MSHSVFRHKTCGMYLDQIASPDVDYFSVKDTKIETILGRCLHNKFVFFLLKCNQIATRDKWIGFSCTSLRMCFV